MPIRMDEDYNQFYLEHMVSKHFDNFVGGWTYL